MINCSKSAAVKIPPIDSIKINGCTLRGNVSAIFASLVNRGGVSS